MEGGIILLELKEFNIIMKKFFKTIKLRKDTVVAIEDKLKNSVIADKSKI